MSNAGELAAQNIEVPAVQPVQVPFYPGQGGVTVTNTSTGTRVDLATESSFARNVQTLAAGSSAYFQAGPVWCRVTPGQAGSPASATITTQAGLNSLAPTTVTVDGTVVANITGTVVIDANGSTVTIGPGPVSYVNVPDPAAGSDWAYTFPSELRLVGCRAVLTTSAQVGQRIPYLWQVVSADTLPTAEVLFSPHAVPPSVAVVLNAVPGGTPPSGGTPRTVVDGGLTTTLATIYSVPGGGSFRDGQLTLTNTSSASVGVVVHTTDGTVLYQDNALASGTTVVVPVPGLQAGESLSAIATADSAVSYTLAGTESAGAHYVVGFSGLLMPTGSFVGTATGNLQTSDQWSQVQLAFTEN
jgi:hypothetical protein